MRFRSASKAVPTPAATMIADRPHTTSMIACARRGGAISQRGGRGAERHGYDGGVTRDEFRRFFENGDGRAIRFLQRVTPTPYLDVLLDACTAPCEGAWTPSEWDEYLFRAIQFCGHQAQMRDFVLTETRRRSAAGEWINHLEALSIRYALAGDAEFATLVRGWASTYEGDERNTPLFGVTMLDGPAGFVTIAANFGRQLARGKKTISHHICEFFGDEREQAHAMTLTREAAATDEDVRRYVEHHDALVASLRESVDLATAVMSSRATLAATPYSEIARRIRERDSAAWSSDAILNMWRWGQFAPDEAVEALARDIDPEAPADILREQLVAFRSRSFPGDPSALLRLVDHDDRRVSAFSMRALKDIHHSSCREIAWRHIESGRLSTAAIDLLEQDLQEEDLRRLMRLLPRDAGSDSAHEIAMGVVHLAERFPADSRAIGPLLLWCYEHVLTEYWRGEVVRSLAERGLLTREIADDCLMDESHCTREIARKWLAGEPIARPAQQNT